LSEPIDPSSLEARVAALEARLADAESLHALYALKARYGAVTDGRYDRRGRGVRPREELEPIAREISELFTEDAIWDGGERLGRCVGRQAIYERFLEPTISFAFHLFVKPQLDVAGDLAHGTWDLIAPFNTHDGRAWWTVGVEHDRYQRVGGRWLHSYMRLETVFTVPYASGWVREAKDVRTGG